MRTPYGDIDRVLVETEHQDHRRRSRAVVQLCPCHVRHNIPSVWDRLLNMASDCDPKVRHAVLHALTDGSPRSREADVAEVLQRMSYDDDQRLRRKARKIAARYRRTGNLNIS